MHPKMTAADIAHQPQTATPQETETAATSAAAIAWWQFTSLIDVSGPDAAGFLDGIVTQHVATIPVGAGALALVLTPKAKIIAPLVLWRTAEESVTVEVEQRLADEVVSHLKKYRLRSACSIELSEASIVSLVGPAAPEIATAAIEAAGTGDVVHLLTSPCWGSPAVAAIGSRSAIHGVLQGAVEHGAIVADPEALDALRIRAGIPCLADMEPDRMPAEVGAVPAAVSLTKGCYLGQEPVARLHYRGRANRTLRRVVLTAAPDPASQAGAPLALTMHGDDGRAVGTLTSWAHAADGTVVGMAVVRREIAAESPLNVGGSDTICTVQDGPDPT